MRSLSLWLFIAGICLAAARPALAEDYEASGGTEQQYRHGGQFKVYGQVGAGYRIIFPYHDDYCGDAELSYCRGGTPLWLELGLGYGVTDAFEVLTDVRLGIGEDFAPATGTKKGPKQLVIAPGIRFFIDDAGSIKFFTTFQLAIDRTDYSAAGVSAATDVGLRNVNGFLVDLHRTFGIYVHVGETISFVRWLRFEVDGGIGMMVRVP